MTKPKKAIGQPKVYGDEEVILTNFRFSRSLLDEIEAAKHALGLPSAAEVVRKALAAYLETNDCQFCRSRDQALLPSRSHACNWALTADRFGLRFTAHFGEPSLVIHFSETR